MQPSVNERVMKRARQALEHHIRKQEFDARNNWKYNAETQSRARKKGDGLMLLHVFNNSESKLVIQSSSQLSIWLPDGKLLEWTAYNS